MSIVIEVILGWSAYEAARMHQESWGYLCFLWQRPRIHWEGGHGGDCPTKKFWYSCSKEHELSIYYQSVLQRKINKYLLRCLELE